MRTRLALALALACGTANTLAADELQLLRDDITQLRQRYETRLDEMEARLKQAEIGPTRNSPPAAQAQTAAGVFNPAISLILSGGYTRLSRDPAGYRIAGFMPSGEIGPGPRGFNLAESELGIHANVDPWFHGGINVAVHPDDTVSAEEAFLQTTALPAGWRVKFGRFFSGIGYLNEQHAHTWDFVDAPLAYQAFLGGQLGGDGVQLRWLVPTDHYVELGAEIGRGRNFPGTDTGRNGADAAALFAHTGADLGDSHSWRTGLAWHRSLPRDRQFVDPDTGSPHAFSGDSTLWLADFVWKWAPRGNATRTSFKLQGEYFRRRESGELTSDPGGASANTDVYASAQSGWYLQSAYQFLPAWRVGVRRDRLDSGSVGLIGNAAVLAAPSVRPRRDSLMVDWSPSEFSRVRLQFARDNARQGSRDNQIFLQYQMSLGAHGSHSY